MKYIQRVQMRSRTGTTKGAAKLKITAGAQQKWQEERSPLRLPPPLELHHLFLPSQSLVWLLPFILQVPRRSGQLRPTAGW